METMLMTYGAVALAATLMKFIVWLDTLRKRG